MRGDPVGGSVEQVFRLDARLRRDETPGFDFP